MKIHSLFVLLCCVLCLTSCTDNVYLHYYEEPKELRGLWKVGNIFFHTFTDAVNYINDSSTERTAILQRNVKDGERGGGLFVPPYFSGPIVIDFNGYTYEFDDSLNYFFLILGGDETTITGGTSVIYNEASHIPKAVEVQSGTVHLVSHYIDDRRINDTPTGNHGFGIGEIVVPSLPSAPEGKLIVTRDADIYTVEFVPFPHSDAPLAVTCRYFCNGVWSPFLTQSEDGTFSFAATKSRPYKIVLNAYNEGGTLVLEKTVNT